MKKIILPIIVLFAMQAGFSQNIFQASTIPANLLANAHSVKREEKISFKVKSIDEAVLSVHQVFTILDEGGEDKLFFMEYSDKFQELSDAEIKVYDSNGKQLNKYKKREMVSQAIGEGLVADAMAWYFRVTAQSFPFTVQYDYEIKYNGTMNYPDFEIQEPGEAVENASFIATVPADLDLRFKMQNTQLAPAISAEGKNKIYDWEAKNLLPIKFEEGAAKYKNRYPRVLLSPNKFSLDGKEGDMTSWKNFGGWLNTLYTGLDQLPEERSAFFRNMVRDASNDRQKAAIIYDYLQKNFRYVSIQLGIGGYRPFSAEFTDKKKYGDCKALSNYMKAALEAVGINSYVAIINAEYNSEPVDASFPSNRFNHVIVCIPGKDTTWLECTSTTEDFGVLGTFTENRNALLITREGGVLVPTPKSRSSENKFISTSSINIEEEGSGKLDASIVTTGENKQLLMDVLSEKEDEKKTFLVHYMGYKQPENYLMKKTADSVFQVKIAMELEKVPEFQAGTKMFLAPRSYRLTNASLAQKEPRTLDYYFRYPYEKTDTTVYHLPADYTVEALPKPRDIVLDLYSFKTSYTYDEKENAVITTASLTLKQNRIPASKYAQTQKFFSDVNEEYTDKIVIKKK